MKYAKDRKITSSHTAEVLIEAFPWIKNATGKTVLIKYGGAAMVDPALRHAVMSDIVMLKIMGVNPVIVHGGGAAITSNMNRFGIEVEFKNGQRVTTDEAMDVVKMTLIGKVNEELVLAMNEHGNLAVGVNGTDAGTIIAKQKDPDLGRVGQVIEVNPGYINALIASDYIPIIASVGKGEDGGSYNINADAAACAIASATVSYTHLDVYKRQQRDNSFDPTKRDLGQLTHIGISIDDVEQVLEKVYATEGVVQAPRWPFHR